MTQCRLGIIQDISDDRVASIFIVSRQERYVKFNTNLCHNAFIYELISRHVSALNVGHRQGDCKFFLACVAFSSTCIVEILLMIKIFIMMIKC